MRKTPTLFLRDPDDRRHVLPELTPGCEWVLTGEGTPTRKYDGTCVMLDASGAWWARREVKRDRTPPTGYVPVDFDPVTGRTTGWEPIERSGFVKFHAEALDHLPPGEDEPGTYELIGPRINRNPERAERHELVRHARAAVVTGLPPVLSWENLRETCAGRLAPLGYEGIVWHHPDGRMAKLKVRDFPAAPNR
ncbi:hypothetical protein [Streptomyces sp. NPDC051162]|uniref:hypothetical protein n=1 Tax=unclassified Streptomyces TaxID=2593676 RepID=UPI0034238180